MMADDLGLTRPAACWHNQRDEWVALGCELGLLAGSLGKIARDVVLMSQFEVAELAEPAEPGRGGPLAHAAQAQSGRQHGGDCRGPARAAARGGVAGGNAAGA